MNLKNLIWHAVLLTINAYAQEQSTTPYPQSSKASQKQKSTAEKVAASRHQSSSMTRAK